MHPFDASEFDSLQQALLVSGRRNRSRVRLLDNRGRIASERSVAELVDAFRLTAGRLRLVGVEPGDRLIVCLPTSWQWLDTWFGALFAGALPVSIAPPGALGSPVAQIEKALRIAERIGARALVANQAFLRDAEGVAANLEAQRDEVHSEGDPTRVQRIDVETLQEVTAEPCDSDLASSLVECREHTAFLQLTSGSTGLPRAVEISHRAALHNVQIIQAGVAAPHGGVLTRQMVSWLPLYHDMGLVGCLLNALLTGFDLDLLTPRSFLARPWIWLEALSRHAQQGAVLSTAPNFAYQLCVERVPERALTSLDLSGWRDAMTGSEMVKPETAAAFCERFAQTGFSPAQLRPCYGMAETTLAVTFDQQLRGARTRPVPSGASTAQDLQQVVSCGQVLGDTEVEVRRPDGVVLGPDSVGQVFLRSPSLFSGYYRDPGATAAALQGGWLDSGDLGFLDDQGELYLTGRSKEILILHGQNVMPHEFEWRAEEAMAAGGSQRSAAFSVPTEIGEAPVLIVETTATESTDLSAQAETVARAIGRSMGVPLQDLVLVRRGSIPRTSSGKVQRAAVRRQYLDGSLERRN